MLQTAKYSSYAGPDSGCLHLLPTYQHASRRVSLQLEQNIELCTMDPFAQPISRLCPVWPPRHLVLYAICAISVSALIGPSAVDRATADGSASGCILDIDRLHQLSGPHYPWALVAR